MRSGRLISFSKDEFREGVESTTGALFFTQTLKREGTTLQFDIWDTAGQERFKALGVLYYKSAKAAMVVYDVTNSRSFERALEWVAELHENADPDIIVALVANKVDLPNREVSREAGESLAQERGLLYFEVSAKSGEGVRAAFLELMDKIPGDLAAQPNTSALNGSALVARQPDPRPQGCCK